MASRRRRPKFVGVWLSEAGYAEVDKRAKAEPTSVSEMVRRMLAYASQRMPKEWKP